jgi:hypothetical protein
MITHSSRKQHHRTASRKHCPVVSLSCTQRLIGQLDPRLTVVQILASHKNSVPEVGDVPCEVGVTNLRHVTNSHHPDDSEDNSDHSGEVFFNAPLPPYDRRWRHPSELADEAGYLNNAPALTSSTFRSLASVAAIASVVLSSVLVWVVTPRSAQFQIRPTEQALMSDRDELTTDSNISIGVLDQSTASALPLTMSGYFIATNANLTPNLEVYVRFPNGQTELLRVLEIEEHTNIAWLHSVDTQTHQFSSLHDGIAPPSIALAEYQQGDQLFIASPYEGMHRATIAISTAKRKSQIMWPVDYSLHDHCSGAALNSAQQLVGWCVEIDGARWVVSTRHLVEVLHRLESNDEQP